MRFLNSVGGGRIARIEGQIAYVDDEGFETPVLLKEIVVVMPAGHEKAANAPKVMFDQKAFDEGRKSQPQTAPSVKTESPKREGPLPQPELPVEETSHGEKMNVMLAFEPGDVRHLDKSRFGARQRLQLLSRRGLLAPFGRGEGMDSGLLRKCGSE